ncbi:MAG: TAT-variant-translocated molybdopterin oxidoreductase [Deltaproteobacteria bacterium]|nr:TAT-variant-translocated molybdopterin oxidoreductase [Deltaproteobacteria bacterium]MDQ3295566.1 TAT-variant-translocated molybdopterin oxidoreductase [Myxococcota bacterium]
MSAKEPELPHDHDHDHGHHDNYDAAYAPSTLEPLPATPEYGFWKSLRELEGEAAVQTDRGNNEFPPNAEVVDPMSRRNFFQLMGASMALAGAGACRYEKEEIVPLARRPEDQIPGLAQQYATAFELGGAGHPLLATAFEGRPIKLDGNPEHPFHAGGIVTGTERHAGCSTFAQASILNMYDPDRAQNPSQAAKGSSMDGFRAALPALRQNLAAARVLCEATSSPTVAALKRRLVQKYPGLQWHEYEPLSWDNERLGTRLAFGKSVRPLARLDRCETIVTIDCDLFVEHPAAMRYSRDYARSRKQNGTLGLGKMNRLWSVESTFTNTGAMADHRLGLRSEHGLPFAMALDGALGGAGGTPGSEVIKEKKVAQFIQVLVEELQQNRGRAVVIAGRRQPPAVHALVARINQAIGAPGATLDYIEDAEPDRPSHLESIVNLTKAMAAGQVPTLLILGGNPVYDAPADLEFAAALAKVQTSVHLHEYLNETGQKTSWHVPRAHFLESWGDVRTWDGTITVAQPLIAPLYGGLSIAEMLGMLLGEEQTGEQLVRAAHEELGVAANWRQIVHDGFVPNTALPVAQVTPQANFAMPPLTPGQAAGSVRPNGEVEVTFHYSSFTYDGRYANNAWLQETPDFLTKVTWDNYALVGPETAEALKLENDTMIKVRVDNREITLPCYTMPGQARYSVALVLGGGRTAAGRVGGKGTASRVGWDTYKVRTSTGFDFAVKGNVTSTGEHYELANVQEHWDIRTGLVPKVTQEGIAERLPQLIKETTNEALVKNKGWAAEPGPEQYWDDRDVDTGGNKRHLSLFREHEYGGHRWGMAIDLNTCTGCNSCMVACQAENNVPVVGRKEVINNREMHWIRIDRYFSGTKQDPVIVQQPVACQQCELAPCEQVCPVGATVHSDEGLNDMAYNRCIGTRYCANNCPYKVRRFNFLDWNQEWREARNKVRRLLFNPEVTVRSRGVMEKCTFCVQRIQNAKIHAKAQIRSGQRPGSIDAPLPDGEIMTACQQACPTEAIMFGDLADKDSRVSRLHEDRRGYALLPELYTKPRNRFLARIRNPNPKMPAITAPAAHATSAGGHPGPGEPQKPKSKAGTPQAGGH